MSITIREDGFKRWFYRYVPGKHDEHGLLVFDRATVWEGLRWNWIHLRAQIPLIELLRPSFWCDVKKDKAKGYPPCGCGKTWFQYRMKPALLGHMINGGGC